MSFRSKLSSTFLILSWAFSACNFPNQPHNLEPITPQESIELPLMAVVAFQVKVPGVTPRDDKIYLTILDEVTGLALNVQRHEMQSEGEFIYSTSLPLPVGAIVKYRYSRQGELLFDEHTSNSMPVRYRLYHVTSPGVVRDVVSAWSDMKFVGVTGRLAGRVLDSATGKPIPGLLVTAGGAQTSTDSGGSFLIEGLPPGTHNLVVYAHDGKYKTFQQGAVIAASSTTPATINVEAADLIKVQFFVTLPTDTLAGIPVRLAGNLLQLGNTFSDLAGGMSVLASRMPILQPLPDGRYSIELQLPEGAYIEYKYTLGDGFWNAEHDRNGRFRLRNFIVPHQDAIVVDQVDNWGSSVEDGSVLFDLTVPAETPVNDYISIQFNPFGWTEPLPMWPLGNNRWVYLLYSPTNSGQKIFYRYCRNDQCASADDLRTPGIDAHGRSIEIIAERQTIRDRVENWIWWSGDLDTPITNSQPVSPRAEPFLTGFEFDAHYHPSYTKHAAGVLDKLSMTGAGWSIFTPSWTYTRISPPVIEPVDGHDPFWEDSTTFIELAHRAGLKVAIYPTPDFRMSVEDWWMEASRDFAWWLVWFERYRSFLLYQADLAASVDAQGIILGGEWVQPALPGGKLVDGSSSGVPADAGERWRNLISEIREHFSGKIFWAVEANPNGLNLPPFVDAVDILYLLWSVPLAESSDPDLASLTKRAANYMEREIFPLEFTLSKPVIIAVGYPSADGGLTGCVKTTSGEILPDCIKFSELSRPHPEFTGVTVDLAEQVLAYEAVLLAINERPWIDGMVSRGFYLPAELQDYSISVHGKPAQDLLTFWFTHFFSD